jgi:hypothetical protein
LLLPHECVGSDHDSVACSNSCHGHPTARAPGGAVQELTTSISGTKFYLEMRTIPNWKTLPNPGPARPQPRRRPCCMRRPGLLTHESS